MGYVINFPSEKFTEKYTVNFLADPNKDGEYTVTDVLAIVDNSASLTAAKDKIKSDAEYYGITDVLIGFYDANTLQQISVNFQSDTEYEHNGTIRAHRNAFESFEGRDIIIKIKPLINAQRPNMTTCTLTQFIVF